MGITKARRSGNIPIFNRSSKARFLLPISPLGNARRTRGGTRAESVGAPRIPCHVLEFSEFELISSPPLGEGEWGEGENISLI